jgi:predicted DNA-binding transcriptional regulator YafY
VFVRPPDFRASDAIPEAAWEAGGEDIEATVRFDAEMAWWAERQLTGRAHVTRGDDGSIEATLPVANPEAFIGWLLAFDAHAELLSPPSLRTRLIERVRA